MRPVGVRPRADDYYEYPRVIAGVDRLTVTFPVAAIDLSAVPVVEPRCPDATRGLPDLTTSPGLPEEHRHQLQAAQAAVRAKGIRRRTTRAFPTSSSTPWRARSAASENEQRDEDATDLDLQEELEGDDEADTDETAGRSGSETRHLKVKMGGAFVHITVFHRHDAWYSERLNDNGVSTRIDAGGHRYHAMVSFNPSRLHDPDGWSVCPADVARTWAVAVVIALARAGVLVAACKHVDLEAASAMEGGSLDEGAGQWCEQVECLMRVLKVSRVDATIDIDGAEDTTLWVDAVEAKRQVLARNKERYSDTSIAVRKGERGFRVAVYDKHAQSKTRRRSARAPVGTLRVEVMARRDVLNKRMPQDEWRRYRHEGGGVVVKRVVSRSLAELTPERITSLFLGGFDWVGLNRWIGGNHPLTAHRADHLLKRTRARRLQIQLNNPTEARQRPNRKVGNTQRSYEKLAEQYGYLLGFPMARSRVSLRVLDLVERREQAPGLEWRRMKGFTGVTSGAARTVLRRRRPRGGGT